MSIQRILYGLKIFFVGLSWLLLAIVSFGVLLYTQSNWYDFPEPEPFHGSEYYNPYGQWKGSKGMMCNFHAHSDCWSGLTNGNGTPKDVLNTYDSLGYDLFAMSDYHRVNQGGVQVYEHGWGFLKAHQLVIGASEIVWLDFPFFQNRNQKQTMIDLLKEKNAGSLISIAHPSLRGAYSEEDLELIRGYDCFEAVNKLRKSLKHWDLALSGGNPVFILGSDDCHNYKKLTDIGRCGTYVLSRNPKQDAINIALKQGRHFAVEFYAPELADISEKRMNIREELPLESIEMNGNILEANFNDSVRSIKLIADESDTVLLAENVQQARWEFDGTKTYVRMEYITNSGTKVFSNPIIRSENGRLPMKESVMVNETKTMIYRGLILAVVAFVWALLLRKKYAQLSNRSKAKASRTVFPHGGVAYHSRFIRSRYRIGH